MGNSGNPTRASITPVSHETNNNDDIADKLKKVVDLMAQDKKENSVHQHAWQFAKDYGDDSLRYSKFACLCGAVKRVKQFEVEE